jgi:glycosyltransferase involved in cell wall biosynthesis
MFIGLDASRANNVTKTGVEWYSYHLIQGLKKFDNDNRYFLYTPNKLNQELGKLPNNFEEKILKWPSSFFWTKGRLSLEMLFNKPDILFVPAYTFPFVGGKKNIITWHDLAYERFPEYYSRRELLSLKTGAKRMLKMADKILTVSNFTKSELMEIYNLESARIEVINLGLDSEKYNLNKIKPTSLDKFELTKPYLIFIGRLEEKKNIVNLIKGFNLLKTKFHLDYQLVLIGSSGYGKKKIFKEINESPYKKDIKIFGWLPEEEKINLLAKAKIFIYPSFYEGFGLPLLEAMSLKVPIVASDIPVHREIAENAAIFFQPTNFEELAKTINELANNNELKLDLINRGLERVKNFSWEKTCKKTISVINSFRD